MSNIAKGMFLFFISIVTVIIIIFITSNIQKNYKQTAKENYVKHYEIVVDSQIDELTFLSKLIKKYPHDQMLKERYIKIKEMSISTQEKIIDAYSSKLKELQIENERMLKDFKGMEGK
jgi:uncharacterized coiled-coil protein SlyX